MTRNRAFYGASALLLALGASALVLSARPDAASPPASGPRSVHRERTTPQLPVASYGMGIAYYSVRGNLESRLTLNNKGPNVLRPRVTLYARDGRSHSSGELIVEGRRFIELDLRTLASAAGEGFEDGSLRVAYDGRRLELGGMLTMTNLETGTEWHDQLNYPGATRSSRLEGVWSLPNAAADARLTVTNATSGPVEATVTFSGHRVRTEQVRLGPWQLQVLEFGKSSEPGGGPRDGLQGGITIEHTGAPGAVIARGLVLHAESGYSGVVALMDPAEAKTSTYHAGGVRLLSVGPVPLDPVILARNTGDVSVTVTGRLQVTGAGGAGIPVEFAPVTVEPGATTQLDARAAWRQGAGLTSTEVAGLELEHDGTPGDVVLSATVISQDGDHVFEVPLTDPATLPSGTGGYYWRAEDSRTSLVVLKNMTDEPQRYNLEVRFADGVWAPGLRTIAPRQSVVVDVGAVRQTQEPDGLGRTIPMTATRGQVHWSSSGGNGRAVVGRVEHVDLAHGVSSTYACPMPTNDIFVDAWIDPWFWGMVVGDVVPYAVWEQDEDAFGGGLQSPYEITATLNWSTWNTSVAVVVGPGLVSGRGQGFTGVNASGQSNGWTTYDPSEGEPEDHVSLSLFADVQSQWCEDETRSTMKEEYRQGQVAWTPDCSDFKSSGGSANFTWSELNGGFTDGNPHSPWGIVKSILTDSLEDTRTNYNRGGIRLSSGYRCPHGNAGVGGVQQSRHMFGDAADMFSVNHAWTQQEFDLLRAAALLTGTTELLHWNSYPDHHLHAAW